MLYVYMLSSATLGAHHCPSMTYVAMSYCIAISYSIAMGIQHVVSVLHDKLSII